MQISYTQNPINSGFKQFTITKYKRKKKTKRFLISKKKRNRNLKRKVQSYLNVY